jgi:Xaa-Pro aminopeptidase
MGFSFPPIIASGKNALTLHYHVNKAPLPRNGLLLIDMGVRYESMPSDVSRTLPINGTFNPLQAALYTIVLAAQSVVQTAVKPGISIATLNQLCWKYINTQLDQLRCRITGTLTTPYTTAPHSVSHLIGLAVHDGDPARGYNTMPLKPGMVISNEPGLYVTADLTLDGVHYKESIGIRIEDNLQVTESGCDNLTSCPKTIPDIESLFRSPHTA